MPHSAYGLNEYATSTIKSMNGTTYTMTVWSTLSGGSQTWTLGAAGLQIVYETDNVDDKNSPIITSKAIIPVMVENLTQANWINGIRTSLEEKDAWITIRVGTSGSFIWCGYILMDLETKEDISYPYEATLTAVDGLAALRDIPFIRETNSATGAVPTFPYERQDTYDNAGYQKLMGGTNSWMIRCLDFVGQLLEADDADTGSPQLENYTIQTAMNWWNEDMDGTPAAGTDPLSLIKLSMRNWYSVNDEGFYSVPMVWEVLEMICKNFGMRLIYWNHAFHFIQTNEYNSDEQSSSPYATPVNIPTRVYYYNGGAKADQNYLGSNSYSLYKMIFENSTAPGEGLQKLTGGIYQALPPIKKTTVTYNERAGENIFTGFPLFVTGNLVSGLDTSWSTTGFTTYYKQLPQTGNVGSGVYTSMQMTNADDVDGFVCKLYLDFTNTTNRALLVETVWTIRAKPVDSAWGDADNKVLYRHQGATYAELRWQDYEFPLDNNQQYVYEQIVVPSTLGASPVTINIFDSSTSQTTNTAMYGGDNAGVIPTHTDFSGEWEFQFYTFTEFKSGSTYPMRAVNQGNANYSHGRVVSVIGGLGLNHSNVIIGAPATLEQVPTYYDLNYTNSADQTQSPPFKSIFIPVVQDATDYGTYGTILETQQDSSDNYLYDIGEVFWGDGTGANTFSTIQVYNGSAWVYVSSLGKWAQGSYTWGGSSFTYGTLTYNQKLINLVSQNALYNQSQPILTLSATSALSETNKYYSGSTRLKFMNPLAKLTDCDNAEYMLMHGTFSFTRDEWIGNWVQVNRATPTLSTGTRDIRTQG